MQCGCSVELTVTITTQCIWQSQAMRDNRHIMQCQLLAPVVFTQPCPCYYTHMRFPTACLSIGKASSHPPLKDGSHQRLSCKLVHHLIGSRLIKRVVKTELMVLEVLCEVYLCPWLVDLTQQCGEVHIQYQWMKDADGGALHGIMCVVA